MARNVQTDLILLEIAEGLRSLSTDNDLSQKIKDAHALSDAEKAKADEARAVIAQAEQLRAELKQRENALVDVNTRVAEAKKIEDFNEDTLKKIAAIKNELDAQKDRNFQDAKKNDEERQRLEKVNDSVEVRESKVAEDEKEIAAIKADLKKRADAVQAQTIGL